MLFIPPPACYDFLSISFGTGPAARQPVSEKHDLSAVLLQMRGGELDF